MIAIVMSSCPSRWNVCVVEAAFCIIAAAATTVLLLLLLLLLLLQLLVLLLLLLLQLLVLLLLRLLLVDDCQLFGSCDDRRQLPNGIRSFASDYLPWRVETWIC